MQTDKLTNLFVIQHELALHVRSRLHCSVSVNVFGRIRIAFHLEYLQRRTGSMNPNTNLQHNEFANESQAQSQST